MKCYYCEDPAAFSLLPAEDVTVEYWIHHPGYWDKEDHIVPGWYELATRVSRIHPNEYPCTGHAGVLCKNPIPVEEEPQPAELEEETV
jgi:hypothetical protein